jgi:hypothetical protein
VAERLQKMSIPEAVAKTYAVQLQGATPRMLAALTKPDLKELGFALIHQSVALEAFKEWSEELSSTAAGVPLPPDLSVFFLLGDD